MVFRLLVFQLRNALQKESYLRILMKADNYVKVMRAR